MNEILTPSVPHSDVDDETMLEQISVEIDYSNGQMAQDRKDIESLKAESELLKAETRSILASRTDHESPIRKRGIAQATGSIARRVAAR